MLVWPRYLATDIHVTLLSAMAQAQTESLTIGQLAEAGGVPVSTIRFYERRELIEPDARTASNYRSYSRRTIARVKFIKAAQTTGFNLADIKEMLLLTGDDVPHCGDVGALIRRRLADVRERLEELTRIEQTLVAAEASCCRKNDHDLCAKIRKLVNSDT